MIFLEEIYSSSIVVTSVQAKDLQQPSGGRILRIRETICKGHVQYSIYSLNLQP